MRPMKMLDLCTGIGGFHLAGRMNGHIETICTAEIDSFNIKFIERNLNLDNAGDARLIAVTESEHPYAEMVAQELVPVEETGFTSLCMEDFLEGVLDWPDMLTAGFPCQDVSPANLQGNKAGINGGKSGLVHEILRIIENLEPRYCVFENSSNLPKRGLDYILKEFNRMGFICEWETIAVTHFGLPHYRHRTYLVAYMPETAIAKGNRRVFDIARKRATLAPNAVIPLPEENPELIKEWATVKDTRSIKLRTKRLNSLGNSIVPQIALAIFDSITDAEKAVNSSAKHYKPRKDEKYLATSLIAGWGKVQFDMFSNDNEVITEMPARGIMLNGEIYTGKPDRKLNPNKTQYQGLFSTIIAKDGNNNFTTKSRLNRPGKLGGLVGDVMRLGADVGGLNPEFCEVFMGYPAGYTELAA